MKTTPYATRLVAYMQQQGYQLFRHSGKFKIYDPSDALERIRAGKARLPQG